MEIVKVYEELVTKAGGFGRSESHKGLLMGFNWKVELFWFKARRNKAEMFWCGVRDGVYDKKGMIPTVEVKKYPTVGSVLDTVVASETAEKVSEEFHIVPRR